ncbi:hypothetical protein ABZ070_13795 [Streptomyces sp. NPDC006283]|uniref:hypothetical protein n=1 Tax=Streptomyces sp. NPDC006283 TaxID=3156741 RepID=UPI0033B71D0F
MHRTTKAVLIGAAISMLSVAASGTALAQSQDDGVRTVMSFTVHQEGPGPKDGQEEEPSVVVPTCVISQIGTQETTSAQSNAANGNSADSSVSQTNVSESSQSLSQAQEGTCETVSELLTQLQQPNP